MMVLYQQILKWNTLMENIFREQKHYRKQNNYGTISRQKNIGVKNNYGTILRQNTQV